MRWFMEYWWILVVLLYVILLAIVIWVLNRRGTLATTWPKISLLTSCAIIMLIPAMPSPGSYFNAVIVVFNLLSLLWSLPKSEKSSGSADR
jgi:hypothetical protein